MNILSWNCQGIGSNFTASHINKRCVSNTPDILFLSETRCKANRVIPILNSCAFQNLSIEHPVGLSSGMYLEWGDHIKVDIPGKTRRMIHALVTASVNSVDIETLISFVYGNPKQPERIKDWVFFEEMATQVNSPWLLIGDLNLTLNSAEKLGGVPFSTAPIQNIVSIIESI